MATYYSQGSDLWSTLTNWDTNAGGGGSDPASVAAMDDQTFIIQAGHTITLDVDMSGFANGIAGLTITGGATPGMLVCKYDADGTYHLKIKTATHLVGTTSTNRGRLLANSDGVWGNTGVLPFGRKFIIDLNGTAQVDASNLDIQLYNTEPANLEVATYGTKIAVSSVNTGTDVITLGSAHGWSANEPVCIRSTGTLPSPLAADTVYYVTSPSGADLKLALSSGGIDIDITSEGTGTIEVYNGHKSIATGEMNVLTDITADPQWVATAAVVLVDTNAPETYDQQRTTLSAVAAGTITLASNVDSIQYPGARIVLVQRNIEIRSNGTTAAQVIVDWKTSTFTGSVLRCSIRNTSGQLVNATTFYGYGISSGTGHTITTISGCSSGINTGTGHTVTTISGCGSGIYYGAGHTVTTIGGCNYGIYNGTGHTITTISGCTNGNYGGTGHTVTTISGCSNGISGGAIHTITTISGCASGFRFDRDAQLLLKLRAASVGVPPTFNGRATTGWNPNSGLLLEDYGGVVGASWAFWNFGDVYKDTSVLRPSGAASSIKVVPQSTCSKINYIPIFEWTEFAVPAVETTKTIYVLGNGWTSFPTNSELYFLAEYYNAGSGVAKATIASTQVLTDNVTWTPLSVTFTPGQVGVVRYRAFLKKQEGASFVSIDNALYTS